jgi:hypothetical protein
LIFDVNGGVGNQLFHVATAISFGAKFDVSPILNLRGCDSSKNYGGSWHLQELIPELTKNYGIKTRRARNFIESSHLKIIDRIYPLEYVEQNKVEALFQTNKLLSGLLFIPHIESKLFSTHALNYGFRKILNEIALKKSSKLVFSKQSNAIAFHYRRFNNDTGVTGVDNWFLRNEWYLRALSKISSSHSEIFCFTNSIVDAEQFKSIYPKIKIVGTELNPLDTVLSISRFNNIIQSKSTLSFWAGEISHDAKIISAYPKAHKFSPSKKYIKLNAM